MRLPHSVENLIEATRILKDSGLKVCHHMMLKLLGAQTSRGSHMIQLGPDMPEDLNAGDTWDEGLRLVAERRARVLKIFAHHVIPTTFHKC